MAPPRDMTRDMTKDVFSGITRRINLRELTTLGVGGEAELWEVNTTADLRAAAAAPYRVIGAGSNLCVADTGVKERVIKLGPAYNDLRTFASRVQECAELWLGAATPLPGLVRRSAGLGYGGLEPLLGIPAVLGGALVMNAGTRFGEIKDVVVAAEVFYQGELHELPAEALGLRYRRSALPPGAIVTRVKLRFTPRTVAAVQENLWRVDAARQGQPKIKSAGCAFKNPAGDSAGRLIDAAGLKGLRVGNAMISHEHGNFIVNLGGATAADVLELLDLVREKVAVPLENEWELWGFEDDPKASGNPREAPCTG